MYFTNLKIGKTYIEVYFPKETFANQQPPLNEKDQLVLLEKIAVQCSQTLFTGDACKPDYKKHERIVIFVKNILLPEQSDHTKALVQCSYETRPGIYSEPINLNLNLDEAITIQYETRPLDLPLYNEQQVNDVLTELPSGGDAEWLKMPEALAHLQKQLAIMDSATACGTQATWIDIMQAADQSDSQLLASLCHNEKLNSDERRTAAHFLPDKDLETELLPLAANELNQKLYLGWIEKKLGHANESQNNDKLNDYVLSQKNKLLETIVSHKCKVVEAIAEKHEADYEKLISESQPNKYFAINRKLNYIRKNITIALYKAAQVYYKEIIKEPGKFAEKLLSFNVKFKGISAINLTTLQLSPPEDAIKQMRVYSDLTARTQGSSFESAVDELLQRCAHISFASAFSSAKTTLNEFNQQLHTDPGPEDAGRCTKPGDLYIEIKAPREESILAAPIKLISERGADAVAGIFTRRDKLFQFKPEVAVLENDLLLAANEFYANLGNVKNYLAALRDDAQRAIEAEDQELKDHYIKARYNINAFNDLLGNITKVRNEIEKIKIDIDAQVDALSPFIEASDTLFQLTKNYGVSETDALQFAGLIFDADTFNELNTQHAALQDLIACLPTTESLDDMISAAGQSDSLLLAGKKSYVHTQKINDFQHELTEHARVCETIEDSINATHHKQNMAFGIGCISRFEACNQAIANINTFSDSLAAQKYSPMSVGDAIKLYTKAERQLAVLEDEVDRVEKISSDNLPEDKTIMTAINNKSRLSSETAQLTMQNHKKNLYDLLLCNMVVEATRNFAHWKKMATALDSKVEVTDQVLGVDRREIKYKIPRPIIKLAKIADEPKFDGWENNPDIARNLLRSIKENALPLTGSHEIRQFQLLLGNIINDDPRDLPILTQNLNRLNQSARKGLSVTPIVIERKRTRLIHQQQTFFERNPNLKIALIGAIIGIAALAVAAAIITACVFTGGAPLIVAGAMSVMAIGGAGFAAGILTAAIMVAGTIGGLIGFFGSKAWRSRKAAKAQAQANPDRGDDLFGDNNHGFSGESILPAIPKVAVRFKPFLTERVHKDNTPVNREQAVGANYSPHL